MGTKVKRTYNISAESVETVKRLVEERHIASSQDALIEQAIAEIARRVRDADDARLWSEAAVDTTLQAEIEDIEHWATQDDLDAWNQ
jgi:hypothetical protein